MRTFVFACLLLAIGAIATALRAQTAPAPRTSSLSWVRMPGAEECVATQPLARAVEERLGRTVFVSAAEADVSVEGRIDKQGKGWRAVITLRDAKGALLGTRELASDKPSCESLRESLALVIAVMIDPDASSRPPPSQSQSAQPTATAIPTIIFVPQEPSAAPVERPKPPGWRFDGGAGVVSGAGLVPAPYGGLYAGGIITPPFFATKPPWLVGIEGYGAVFLDAQADAERGASAAFSLAYLGSAVCPAQFFPRWGSLSLCAGSQLGAMRVRGKGFDASKEEIYGLLNLTGGFRASVFLFKPIVFRVTFDGILPLVRDRFVYSTADGAEHAVFRPWLVGAVGTLGLGVQFP